VHILQYTILAELKNEFHTIYKKDVAILKRKYCKCPNKKLGQHKKECEFN